MQLLFCCNPELRKVPEPQFEPEVEAARELGLVCHLMGFEDFLDGRETRAFQFLPTGQGQTLLYRGWMLKESEYHRLSVALLQRGYHLFTPLDSYAEAHYFPNAYAKIAGQTSPAVWMEGTDLPTAWKLARTLGAGPWIVKDWVKSVKQRWESACYIPADTDYNHFAGICQNLIDYQGERFERGLVFKQFVPLVQLGESLYGYPLCEEYRLFFFQHQLLAAAPYDRRGGSEMEFGSFTAVAKQFQSDFISIDVAKTLQGEWLILEVGDGGVSLLPPQLPPSVFYRALYDRYQSAPALTQVISAAGTP